MTNTNVKNEVAIAKALETIIATYKVKPELVFNAFDKYGDIEKVQTYVAEKSKTIVKYAVIDHVGQVVNIKETYEKAFELASDYEAYTLKKVCQASSPYAREITNKMKWYQRYNRNPHMVFIVCGTYDNSVMAVQSAWEDRGIPTQIVEEEPNPTYFFGMEISRYRRCAMIWGSALGWSFSAPLVRDEAVNYKGEMNLGRPIEEEKLHRDELTSYKAVRYTSPEAFQERFLEVASEDECIEFFKHYRWLYENNLLADSLECDYAICPTCGRPHKISQDRCTWCDTEFETIEVKEFFDDNSKYGNDELNFNSFDSYSSIDASIKAYPKRKALIELFDRGCHFPEMDNYYI